MGKNWRVNFILIITILCGATIISRLIFVQVINYEYWKALAQGQQKFFDPVTGERGEVFIRDKKGNSYTLATNKDWNLVCVSQKEIIAKGEKADGIIKKLAEILKEEENAIYDKIRNSNRTCEVLRRKLSQEEENLLLEANLSGVYLQSERLRYYPYQSFASHILGFLGGEGIGQYGLEGYYDENLRGRLGYEEGERGPKFYLIKSSAQKGENLNLTIDYNIQFTAEKLLQKAKEDLRIEGGTIIIGDPNDGKITALANFPVYNPNEYSKEKNLEIFQNSAIQKTYEPGSAFKPITMAAALDSEKITPQTTYVDEGFLQIGGYTIYNFGKRIWGEKSMTEVLERSINTGAVFAEKQAGQKIFLDYIDKFGFFEPTGIDLQGEIFSENRNLRSKREINLATASFGQGIEITPVQLVRAFSAIANGGKLIKPYITETPVLDFKKEPPKQVISQKTASQLTTMLVSVTENGSGKLARIPGYYLAGKTGTAQVPLTAIGIDEPGYSDKTIQTFIGFAPAFNPRFLILIKLDNPNTKTAEYSSAPLFKELAKYIIDYWQIPPDYETLK